MSEAPPGAGPGPGAGPPGEPGGGTDPEPLGSGPGSAPDPPERVGWGPSEVIFGVLMVPVLALLGGLVGLIAGGGDADATATLLVGQAALGLSFVYVAYFFAKRTTVSPMRALGLIKDRYSANTVGVAILVWLGYVLVAALFIALVDVQPNQEDIARELGFEESTLTAIIVGILIVGLAPIAEELFFRGFLYTGLRSAMPMAPAAIVSGILFGSIHLTSGDVVVAGQLSILGVVLAVTYEKTRALWAPIIVHAINNGIAFSVLAFDVDTSVIRLPLG